MEPMTRQRNHQRTLALLFIATGALFGLYGTGIGSIMLAVLSGLRLSFSSSLFSPHPYAQIYGFIFEFVIGVAYILVPRFKAERIRSISLAYLSYAAITASDIFFITSDSFASSLIGSLASALFLFGTLVFALQTISLAFEEKGGFPETNPLIAESALAALLSSIALLLAYNRFPGISIDIFSDSSIYLSLLGFAISMVYAVEIRSVSFRQSDYRPGWANLTWLFQGIAIILDFTSLLTSSTLMLFSAEFFFLLAAVAASISMKLFEMNHPLMYRPSMTQVHYRIMYYNDAAMLPAFIWLFMASAIGLIITLPNFMSAHLLPPAVIAVADSFYMRDLFIHAIAIGFIGSTILCYAPMLLPGLLGRRGPTTGLSYYPLIFLNLGMLFRAAGDFYSLRSGYLPYWEALSGPLILVSMVWFLYMIHNIGKGKPIAKQEQEFLGERRLKGVAEIKIYSSEGQQPSTSPSYWFAFKKGKFYVIPSQHKNFDLAGSINATNEVIVELEGRRLKCSFQISADEKKKKLVKKLFKDKYSHRNFKDFFGNQVEKVIELEVLKTSETQLKTS
ncbi:MAG: hypothetical protein QXE12_06625 [Conexivisphaerales archaeon]